VQAEDGGAFNYLAAISSASSMVTLSTADLAQLKTALDRAPSTKDTQAAVTALQTIDAISKV
jgi:hypothetical protein